MERVHQWSGSISECFHYLVTKESENKIDVRVILHNTTLFYPTSFAKQDKVNINKQYSFHLYKTYTEHFLS